LYSVEQFPRCDLLSADESGDNDATAPGAQDISVDTLVRALSTTEHD
jgi:hypothetical protein